MSRNAFDTPGSASVLARCSLSRKMKCSENTPACGASVEAFAVEVMTKSMSPERIFCSMTGSWPSCAPGNWSMLSLPPLSSLSLASKMSAAMP